MDDFKISEIGKNAMWYGKLSEFYQKNKNMEMYYYYHNLFIEGQEKYLKLRNQNKEKFIIQC